MTAKSTPLVLRDGLARAFDQFFEARTATLVAALIKRCPSTVTRERGPQLDRYSSVELVEFLIDDLRTDRVLIGALVAAAMGASGQDGGRWLARELGEVVQEMMGGAASGVGALADGSLDDGECRELASKLRPLVGHLSTLLHKLEGGAA